MPRQEDSSLTIGGGGGRTPPSAAAEMVSAAQNFLALPSALDPICAAIGRPTSGPGVGLLNTTGKDAAISSFGRSFALSPVALGLMTVAHRNGLLSICISSAGQADAQELGKARLIHGLCTKGFLAPAGEHTVVSGRAVNAYEDFRLTACGAAILERL